MVEDALLHHRVLEFEYRSVRSGEFVTRRVDPLGIYYTDTSFVVASFCHEAKAFRDFRLDQRFRDLRVLDIPRCFPENETFDLAHHLEIRTKKKVKTS